MPFSDFCLTLRELHAAADMDQQVTKTAWHKQHNWRADKAGANAPLNVKENPVLQAEFEVNLRMH